MSKQKLDLPREARHGGPIQSENESVPDEERTGKTLATAAGAPVVGEAGEYKRAIYPVTQCVTTPKGEELSITLTREDR